MSRYVHVALRAVSLDEIERALVTLQVPHARGEQMLRGSLECAGEPVALRVEPGPVGAVEDFGFVVEGDGVRLVCGELDRAHLQADLLARVHAEIARARVVAAGRDVGLEVDEHAAVLTVRRRR